MTYETNTRRKRKQGRNAHRITQRLTVKVKQMDEKSSQLLTDLQESVEDVKLIKAGKLKGRPVEDLLGEL